MSLSSKCDDYELLAEVYQAAVAKARRDAELEARMARTTPAQRKREREATLLRIKSGQS